MGVVSNSIDAWWVDGVSLEFTPDEVSLWLAGGGFFCLLVWQFGVTKPLGCVTLSS
jgi:hypothetical protein